MGEESRGRVCSPLQEDEREEEQEEGDLQTDQLSSIVDLLLMSLLLLGDSLCSVFSQEKLKILNRITISLVSYREDVRLRYFWILICKPEF